MGSLALIGSMDLSFLPVQHFWNSIFFRFDIDFEMVLNFINIATYKTSDQVLEVIMK